MSELPLTIWIDWTVQGRDSRFVTQRVPSSIRRQLRANQVVVLVGDDVPDLSALVVGINDPEVTFDLAQTTDLAHVLELSRIMTGVIADLTEHRGWPWDAELPIERTLHVDLARFTSAGYGTVFGEQADGLQLGMLVAVTDEDADTLTAEVLAVTTDPTVSATLRVHWGSRR
jgi:hypothetical protein